MTVMDAIRAEVTDWANRSTVGISDEVMTHFYTESLGGGTTEELAEVSVDAILGLVGPVPRGTMTDFMAIWCSGVLLGVRAARKAGEV